MVRSPIQEVGCIINTKKNVIEASEIAQESIKKPLPAHKVIGKPSCVQPAEICKQKNSKKKSKKKRKIEVNTGLPTKPRETIGGTPSNPIEVIIDPRTNPIEAISGPPTNPIEAIRGTPSNPIEVIIDPRTNPIEAISGPPTNPIEAISGPPINPIEAISGTPINPIEAINGTSTNPIEVITDPPTNPIEAITDPHTNPMEVNTGPPSNSVEAIKDLPSRPVEVISDPTGKTGEIIMALPNKPEIAAVDCSRTKKKQIPDDIPVIINESPIQETGFSIDKSEKFFPPCNIDEDSYKKPLPPPEVNAEAPGLLLIKKGKKRRQKRRKCKKIKAVVAIKGPRSKHGVFSGKFHLKLPKKAIGNSLLFIAICTFLQCQLAHSVRKTPMDQKHGNMAPINNDDGTEELMLLNGGII